MSSALILAYVGVVLMVGVSGLASAVVLLVAVWLQ